MKRRHWDTSSSNTAPLSSFQVLELIETPNFEELARHHPAFATAWNETRKRQKEKDPGASISNGSAATATTTTTTKSNNSFSSSVTQDFTICLTRALLQAYFQLKLPYLDVDHLCPPVPNRFFYLHWIHTTLLPQQQTLSPATQHNHSQHHVHQNSPYVDGGLLGLDIGAGATCIYSLLASKFFQSHMITTEIDPQALELARKNVTANHLDRKIQVLAVPPSHSQQPDSPPGGPLARALQVWNTTMQQPPPPAAAQPKQEEKTQPEQTPEQPKTTSITPKPKSQPNQLHRQRLDFVMTNPPFYDPTNNNEQHQEGQPQDHQHQELPQASKLLEEGMTTRTTRTASPSDAIMMMPPRVGDGRARTNMTVSEGHYPGGEVGFVSEMIVDSLVVSGCSHDDNDNNRQQSTSAARWFSTMLGKKTSLVYLQKLLIHLLGHAHVQATEYGPGQYTRWFLAWTLDRPLARSPLARVQIDPQWDKFFVSDFEHYDDHENADKSDDESMDISSHGVVLSSNDAVREVVNRMITFCDASPGGWNLSTEQQEIHHHHHQPHNNKLPNQNPDPSSSKLIIQVSIQEEMPPAINNFVDEGEPNASLPDAFMKVLPERDNCTFLPFEGHFLIDATVRAVSPSTTNVPSTPRTSNGTDTNNNKGSSGGGVVVEVQLECYRHSSRGIKAVNKIRNSLSGEVCRTNRKWRRIRQRNSNQTTNQTLPPPPPPPPP